MKRGFIVRSDQLRCQREGIGSEEEKQFIIDYVEGLGPNYAVRITMPPIVMFVAWLRFSIYNKILNAKVGAATCVVETVKAYKELLTEITLTDPIHFPLQQR